MDLFIQGTFKEQINLLKDQIKKYNTSKGIHFSQKFALVYGDKDNVGNNILFITPPYIEGCYYEDKYTKELINTLKTFKINNYFITYSCHTPTKSKKEVKEYSVWIKRIIEVIMPKLIVCVGELSLFSIFKQKVLINDFHGTIIDNYNNIPVILTFPMDYYIEKSTYEDNSYKNFIKDNDWNNIKLKYKEYIKNANI